jgi:hypothetical protein
LNINNEVKPNVSISTSLSFRLLQSHLRYELQYLYMCGLDYESVLNVHKKEDNKQYIEDLHKQKGFTKAMEGPGGYFLEPGGYIVDKRNTTG